MDVGERTSAKMSLITVDSLLPVSDERQQVEPLPGAAVSDCSKHLSWPQTNAHTVQEGAELQNNYHKF